MSWYYRCCEKGLGQRSRSSTGLYHSAAQQRCSSADWFLTSVMVNVFSVKGQRYMVLDCSLLCYVTAVVSIFSSLHGSFCLWWSCDRDSSTGFALNLCWLKAVQVELSGRPSLSHRFARRFLMSEYCIWYSRSSFSPSLCVKARDSWIGSLFGRLPHPCLLDHCWWNKRAYGLLSPCITSSPHPSRFSLHF